MEYSIIIMIMSIMTNNDQNTFKTRNKSEKDERNIGVIYSIYK